MTTLRIPRLVVAGTHSGVGKTTVATGVMAALAGRGLTVAPGKIGPDYIDPSYHTVATGRPGRNLDAVLCGADLLAPLLAHGAGGADVAVVEGVMGMFDGASRPLPGVDPAEVPGDPASTAHVAYLLDAPVVLVVDAAGLSRSVAALVHGYATLDPRVRLAGVIANRVGGERHADLLRSALAPLGVPLLGALPHDDALGAPSRHLGLVPVAEREAAARTLLDRLAARVADHCDLDALLGLARSAPPLPVTAWEPPRRDGEAVRVGVAAGPAFSFTYRENLELLEAAGAELVPFDPTRDETLPEATEALLLVGGFPEAHAEALAANAPLRARVAALARAGAPVHAECGGLCYLTGALGGHEMCGVLDARAGMTDGLAIGYRAATPAGGSWWPASTSVHAHEFHQAQVTPAAGAQPAWEVDGAGPEGFVAGGVHASFLHTHWAAHPQVAAAFVAAARQARAA